MANKALLIGVNKYGSNKLGLRGCVEDACAWERLIDSLEFDTDLRVTKSKTKKDAILAAIGDLVDGVKNGTVVNVVVFFAGHGHVEVDANGQVLHRYLCPSDVTASPLPKKLIDIDGEILKPFKDLNDVEFSLVLILDACFVGRPPARPSPSPVPVHSLFFLGDEVESVGPRGRTYERASVRALRDVGVVRQPITSVATDPRITVVTSSSWLPSYETKIFGTWRGTFSLAATTLLSRWKINKDADPSFALTYAWFLRVTTQWLYTLGVHQDPYLDGGKGTFHRPVFHRSTSKRKPPVTKMPIRMLPKRQLSGGWDGFRVYEGRIGGTLVLQILVTGPAYQPPNGDSWPEPDTEYWEVKLSSVEKSNFVLTVRDGQTQTSPNLDPNVDGKTWIAVPTTPVPVANGDLPSNDYTWATGASKDLPYLKLRPSIESSEWVRSDVAPVGAGMASGTHVVMTYVGSSLSYADAYFSEDVWDAWP
ncbi:MAG: caspase family protein [Myxococcales bacterium]|nr:caspase family protein [Myxococcales bacterium]